MRCDSRPKAPFALSLSKGPNLSLALSLSRAEPSVRTEPIEGQTFRSH